MNLKLEEPRSLSYQPAAVSTLPCNVNNKQHVYISYSTGCFFFFPEYHEHLSNSLVWGSCVTKSNIYFDHEPIFCIGLDRNASSLSHGALPGVAPLSLDHFPRWFTHMPGKLVLSIVWQLSRAYWPGFLYTWVSPWICLDSPTAWSLSSKRQEMEAANLLKLKLRICNSIITAVLWLPDKSLSLFRFKGRDIDPNSYLEKCLISDDHL